MQAKNKYSRAMRDVYMVRPTKPQAIKNKPSAGFCVATILIFIFFLLPAFMR